MSERTALRTIEKLLQLIDDEAEDEELFSDEEAIWIYESIARYCRERADSLS